MLSALKLVLFLALYGAVSSSEPVVIHEKELLQMEEDLELKVEEAIEAGEIQLQKIEEEGVEIEIIPTEQE